MLLNHTIAEANNFQRLSLINIDQLKLSIQHDHYKLLLKI